LRNYYDMLSVAQDAPPDEIKKAFRREIARYHPDKVQHLGPEFQEMAAGIAADLTEAYRILMDPGLRAKYDEEMRAGPHSPPPMPRQPQAPEAAPPPPSRPPRGFTEVTPPPSPRPTAGLDFVKRVALSKIREAIPEVLGTSEPIPAREFDVALVTRPKKALFRKAEESVCVVIKFVPFVDAEAVSAVWGPASKIKAPGAVDCAVILLGQGLSPARDLAAAVSEQRRKARGAGPVLVPVDVRDWEALFPPETPGAVRSLIQRLKDGKQ
jgi:DnaJ domain